NSLTNKRFTWEREDLEREFGNFYILEGEKKPPEPVTSPHAIAEPKASFDSHKTKTYTAPNGEEIKYQALSHPGLSSDTRVGASGRTTAEVRGEQHVRLYSEHSQQ